jgi:hypothetical protein
MKKAIKYTLWIILINAAVSITVYRFFHPEETETELFIHIPKAFIWRLN